MIKILDNIINMLSKLKKYFEVDTVQDKIIHALKNTKKVDSNDLKIARNILVKEQHDPYENHR